MNYIILITWFISNSIWANPFPDPSKVISLDVAETLLPSIHSAKRSIGSDVLRVEIHWNKNESYSLGGLFLEKTGTPAFTKASKNIDPLGSYKAQLIVNGSQKFYSSIGTGKEFRQLVRTICFRFPLIENALRMKIIVMAEHPETGVSEKVLEQDLILDKIQPVPVQEVKITQLRKALK
jgi:hypothetical protein